MIRFIDLGRGHYLNIERVVAISAPKKRVKDCIKALEGSADINTLIDLRRQRVMESVLYLDTGQVVLSEHTTKELMHLLQVEVL